MPGMKGTMEEFKAGTLHSGSKHGPLVKNRKQAIAIGLSEQRKAGGKAKPKKRKGKAKSKGNSYYNTMKKAGMMD